MSKKTDETIPISRNGIEKRLDAIISILPDSNIRDETQLKKIQYLSKLSFSNPEIAHILHTSIPSIESQKYRKPKEKK